ncbi:MAG: hypothetical protein IJE19_07950 [Clostridia bacterium]|nr:hypothetical protein [Clostridia bacterium]
MSKCIFLTSDCPLENYSPSKEYPIEINVDTGEIFDGGADDNFFLNSFKDTQSYSDKKFGVCLEWNYTDGRAKNLIEYIKIVLKNADSVELWNVWLDFYYEYDESPVIHNKTVSVSDLSVNVIRNFVSSDNFNMPDIRNPERPSFYRLTITQ